MFSVFVFIFMFVRIYRQKEEEKEMKSRKNSNFPPAASYGLQHIPQHQYWVSLLCSSKYTWGTFHQADPWTLPAIGSSTLSGRGRDYIQLLPPPVNWLGSFGNTHIPLNSKALVNIVHSSAVYNSVWIRAQHLHYGVMCLKVDRFSLGADKLAFLLYRDHHRNGLSISPQKS